MIEIRLTRGKTTIIDDIDADLVPLGWFYVPSDVGGYATRGIYRSNKSQYIRMHRVILGRILGRPLRSGEEPDHINGDGLDNRRFNIRPATRLQNSRNKSPYRNSLSKFKGVGPAGKKWRARIKVEGKSIHLGVFGNETEAAQAYNTAALLHFGEFAYLNPIYPV